MLPLVAAKKTASVIAFMMLELLAFYVSRPAMFFIVCGHRERYLVGANLQPEIHLAHIVNFRNPDRAFSIINADH
jgi:hypothetical protein